MDFWNTQSIWVLRVLIYFTIYNGESNAWKLADLKRVCVYYFPFNTANSPVKPMSGLCTAVASFSEYGLHPSPENLDVKAFKGNLPYVFFYDKKSSIDGMFSAVTNYSFQSTVTDLDSLITKYSIDIMVFDFIKSDDDRLLYTWVDDENQNNLKKLFSTMKQNHNNMLFGLKIHRNSEINNLVFNIAIIKDSIDFYVVSSYDYEHCHYHNHQRSMAPPPTADELVTTITDLTNAGYDQAKMFLTIELVLKSWKDDSYAYPEYWSYSWMCQANPGKKRKFCIGNLDNYYQQGKVIFDQKMPGVFIQAFDCDDYDNVCLCDSFPAIRSIRDGLNGSPENQTLSSCSTFSMLPRDRS